ncbi:glycosyltransferase [Pseudomonas sp. 5P_3.1_Bac2]|uniref:glycosyltransferase n=1 Tax=Pseudomonas sp. 5P_3.1_Bac2 TaxID=2971617 RepID=UPI0021C593A2|nr:glycosyltransferase [Pseudomonas sp. 5P_3.1_Bac2]MCU1719138.1 glycosyltransferase [Pseudomonas sp. 5P_3.1_Bac2]
MRVTDIGNLCFERPIYLSGMSAWAELIPLAFTLIEKLKPGIFVELGTHYGDSYLAFCQAIQKAGVNCRAYAVDTWEGDEHAGFYGEDVLNLVRSRHDVPYSGFSRLLRETFDEAATYFSPKSVDLLHIDGLHTYEAVKHDFITWLPLLSDRAVVIFHDINVHERDFGVWKLFEEISQEYPTFRFDHSHGLGIAAIGKNIPEDIKFLFELSDSDALRIKEFYSALGLAITNERRLADALQVQNAAVADAQEQLARITSELKNLQDSYTVQMDLTNFAEAESLAKDNVITELQDKLSLREQAIAESESKFNQDLRDKIVQLDHELVLRKNEIHSILNSRSWRVAAVIHRQAGRARKVRAAARKVLIAKEQVGGWGKLYARVIRTLRTGGVKSLKAEVLAYMRGIAPVNMQPKDVLKERAQLAFAEIEQRLTQPPVHTDTHAQGIKISLIMPVYKVPVHLLSLAIESVMRQSYTNWELCIADDCSESAELTALLTQYVKQDSRIKFETLQQNVGIANATNHALKLATGEYIALLDNDDVLTNDALHWIADAVQKNGALDWIYSDECKVDEAGSVLEIFNKPDWSPSLLLNCMYTGHLSAYRRSLVDELGGLRSEFDFSQDYDLALRVSEKTENIYHIERVLYGWRAIESSGAAGGKPYARNSNIRALQAAGDRRGWKGTAIALPTANRFKFDLEKSSSKVSIVIPSDNAQNIIDSIESVCSKTSWVNYEILVVTNSGIVDALSSDYSDSVVKFVRYDLPYSFSDKCNKGAEAAEGEYIIFFNDDVRVQSADWVESIIEFLQLPKVGIVGPKLVYESNTIQHAGMVTGVRRLLGTAFHCLPEDTGAHYNFAQSVREVSLICGACLGIRKDVFEQIGGFDIFNTPINHSDVDLCFKVRELGYSCVYTPHSTLTHIGHMSLATVDAKEKIYAPKKKDKADIFILRRWAGFLARDPFYTKSMREQLFHDSPQHFEVFAKSPTVVNGGKDVLLYSHDLTESGAPRVVFELAKILTKAGNFVVVASPSDGPIRKALEALGVIVIVDELLLTQHASVYDFARNFDVLICNTVLTYPIVIQLSKTVDTYWYIHETSLFTHMVGSNSDFVQALTMPKQIWAGSKLAAAPIKSYNPRTKVLEYGFPALARVSSNVSNQIHSEKLIVRTFGSYELRKGQDLLTLAIKGLPESLASQCEFEFYGRILDQGFFDGVSELAKDIPHIKLLGDVDYDEYADLIFSTDLVVVPSRDDTLPLVSLHALSAGKALMCTATTGTSDYIDENQSGFIFYSNNPSDMTYELADVIKASLTWVAVGQAGKAVFNQHFSEDRFSQKLLSQMNFN